MNQEAIKSLDVLFQHQFLSIRISVKKEASMVQSENRLF